VTTRLRRLQRHVVPSLVVSLLHYWKARALVSPRAQVQWNPDISLGRGTVVKAFAVIQTSGGIVSFGRECAISSFVHISAGSGDIVAGDFVRIAASCTFVGSTKEVHAKDVLIKDQPEIEARGIRIGDDVFIGAGVVILPGAAIGRGAVIGAGSVVMGNVAEYTIVAGTPARVIGRRE